MNKHAYLIIAHQCDDTYRTLLKMLDDPRNDIYIHMDKKNTLYEESYCSFVVNSKIIHTRRTNVTWGGYSQINAELLLLEEAIRNGDYKYLHLISGQDLPIKSQDYIHDYLESSDTEFVGIMNDCGNIQSRIAYYHLFQELLGRNSAGILVFLNKLFLRSQRIFGIRRKIDREIKKGCNWFTITGKCAKYVIDNKGWVEKHFKNTFCCDEVFLQTLLFSSPFKDKINVNVENDSNISALRCIDWKRGRPYTFTLDDYDLLCNSQMLFARKFNSSVDKEIIEKIYNTFS